MTNTHHAPRPRDLYAEVTDRIIAALEGGTAPWVCPWDRRREPGQQRNGASGHVYKGVNVILTGMSGFVSSRWYTFNQAKALGGHVRRGERGTQVVCWRFIDAKTTDQDEDGDEGTAIKQVPLLRCYHVWNADQIEWLEGSIHAPAYEGSPNFNQQEDATSEAARALVDASGADLRHGGVKAYYAPGEDYVRVPEVERFSARGDYYATILHELAHWTGHKTRLARDLTGRFGSDAYAAEELVAELAAAFLCADLGVPGRLQHAEYIGAWVKVLQGDKRAIFTASRMAQEAADHLLRRAGRAGAQDTQEGAVEAALRGIRGRRSTRGRIPHATIRKYSCSLKPVSSNGNIGELLTGSLPYVA